MSTLISRVERFDTSADRVLEHIRGYRASEVVFRTASFVGDFSAVWLAIGVLYGVGVDGKPWHALGFGALMGVESLVVNQGIKRLFRRTRPTETGDPRFVVRKPRSSSFPSGHASSAFFAATLLTVWAGWAWAPVWFVIALVVAISRAVVRIHHASDVVAGLITGLVLAQVALAFGADRLFTG